MDKSELQNIIEKLEANSSPENAYFGLFENEVDQGEGFIKANKEGLSLFAAAILKALRDVNYDEDSKADNFYPVDPNKEWIDQQSHTVINYITPSNEPKDKAKFKPYIQTSKDKIFRTSCGLIFIIGIIVFIIGAITIVKWLL